MRYIAHNLDEAYLVGLRSMFSAMVSFVKVFKAFRVGISCRGIIDCSCVMMLVGGWGRVVG